MMKRQDFAGRAALIFRELCAPYSDVSAFVRPAQQSSHRFLVLGPPPDEIEWTLCKQRERYTSASQRYSALRHLGYASFLDAACVHPITVVPDVSKEGKYSTTARKSLAYPVLKSVEQLCALPPSEQPEVIFMFGPEGYRMIVGNGYKPNIKCLEGNFVRDSKTNNVPVFVVPQTDLLLARPKGDRSREDYILGQMQQDLVTRLQACATKLKEFHNV